MVDLFLDKGKLDFRFPNKILIISFPNFVRKLHSFENFGSDFGFDYQDTNDRKMKFVSELRHAEQREEVVERETGPVAAESGRR